MSEESVSADALRDLYRVYCQVSFVVDERNYNILARLACVLKDLLTQRRDELIRSAAGMPLICSYQSDATSYLSDTISSGAVGGNRFTRHGRELVEYLFELYTYMVRTSSGEIRSRFILRLTTAPSSAAWQVSVASVRSIL